MHSIYKPTLFLNHFHLQKLFIYSLSQTEVCMYAYKDCLYIFLEDKSVLWLSYLVWWLAQALESRKPKFEYQPCQLLVV